MDSSQETIADSQNKVDQSDAEIETIETWTFLEDEPRAVDNDPILNQQHEDITALLELINSSTSETEKLLHFTPHPNEGDLSDGISIISDSDSFGRLSPVPQLNMQSNESYSDDMNATQNTLTGSRVEDFNQDRLVERSNEIASDVVYNYNEYQRQFVWNPTNVTLFGLIVVTVAFLLSQYLKMNSSILAKQIQDLKYECMVLKNENMALKNELKQLYVQFDEPIYTEVEAEEDTKPSFKEQNVWTGDDETPIRINMFPKKNRYCNDEYLSTDDLFSAYNALRCEMAEERDSLEEQKLRDTNQKVKNVENDTEQFETRKHKDLTKEDSGSNKRQTLPESDEIIRKSKFLKKQENLQKYSDELKRKHSEKQKKMQKKLEKDRKHNDNILKNNKMRKQSKDPNAEWYDRMMKRREELRSMSKKPGGENKENWYIKRGNERERVRAEEENREQQNKLNIIKKYLQSSDSA